MIFPAGLFEDDSFKRAVMLLNANQYGLPQARKRIYFAAIPFDHSMIQDAPTAGIVDAVEQTVRT